MLVRAMSLVAVFMVFAVCDAKADNIAQIKGRASCESIVDQSKQMLCRAFMVAASEDDDCDEIADNSGQMICNAVSEASEGDVGNKKAMKYCEKVASDDDRALCYSAVFATINAASE
ncbi:MAG: hypothetical protein WCO00_12815 [Rhodospirillaceae bacterium]